MILPEPELLVAFAVAATVLALNPGPDMAYVATRTLAGGRAAGVAAALGILTGLLVHTLFAAIGLSSLLHHSALAFDIVKYAGAAYLVWLAIKLWREIPAGTAGVRPPPAALARVFAEGLLTNVLNPKVALFFLALLPQFVAPEKGGVAGQMIVLGLIMVAIGLVMLLAVVAMTARAKSVTETSTRLGILLRRLAAFLFVGFAIRLAMAQRS